MIIFYRTVGHANVGQRPAGGGGACGGLRSDPTRTGPGHLREGRHSGNVIVKLTKINGRAFAFE